MIRLTKSGAGSLQRFLLGFLFLAPLMALAAPGDFTDRIIVKYRSTPASSLAQADQIHGTDVSAARFGVTLDHIRTTALGSHVLKLDRRVSIGDATRLAPDIAA